MAQTQREKCKRCAGGECAMCLRAWADEKCECECNDGLFNSGRKVPLIDRWWLPVVGKVVAITLALWALWLENC